MTPLLILVWIALVSACAVGAAWYARRFDRADALIALYVLALIIANLAAQKIVAFDLGVAVFFAPVATLLFAVTFLITDIVNEKFGRAETQRMIWIAFSAQIMFLVISYLVVRATPAPFFTNQAAFASIFGNVPRIAIASLVTFLISESLDAYLFQWVRARTHGKHLWMRNVFSSLPAMALDSTLFIVLAFYGTSALIPLIVGQIVIKWVVGVIDTPFMYLARAVSGERHSA